MKNLKELGLALKTIQPDDYGRLIEDINYNFLQILTMSGFKGAKGESIKGDDGIGIRGTRWIFSTVSDFEKEFGVKNENDINIIVINKWFVDYNERFVNCLTIPDDNELVYGDTLVIPSGQVLQLNKTDIGDRFEDTGITFAQVSQLTVEEVTNIVKQLIGDQSSNYGLKYYKALAKNSHDGSPKLNSSITQDSTIDIDVVGGGVGVEIPNYVFLAPNDVKVGGEMGVMLLTGSANLYHNLIQATQKTLNNDYTCGVNDWGALAVMQNSYENGIILGHKNSQTFKSFSRIYKSTDALVLTSSYSPNTKEYSYISLKDNRLEFFSDMIKPYTKELNLIDVEKINAKMIQHYGDTLELGGENGDTTVTTKKGLVIKYAKNVYLLGTDTNGKLTKIIDVTTKVDNNSNDKELPTAKTVNTIRNDINTSISKHDTRITKLENQDTSHMYKRVKFINKNNVVNGEYNLNNFQGFGDYTFADFVKLSNVPDYKNDIPDFNSNEFYPYAKLSVKTSNGKDDNNTDVMVVEQEFTIFDRENFQTKGIYKWVRSGISVNKLFNFCNWEIVEINIGHKLRKIESKTDFIQKGLVMIWKRPLNEVPKGWGECVDLRGRIPLGMNPNDVNFNTLNGTGGSREVTLLESNLPKFSYENNWFEQINNDWKGGGRHTGAYFGYNRQQYNVFNGQSRPFSVMNPYRIVHFIEYVGE